MTGLISDDDSFEFLRGEVRRRFPHATLETVSDRVILTDAPVESSPPLMFVRQALPNAQVMTRPSINTWAQALVDSALTLPAETTDWRLHLVPIYGDAKAGNNRVRLIREAVRELLQKRRRSLLRTLSESTEPFDVQSSMVQLVMTEPDQGIVSACPAGQLAGWRHLVSAFPGGQLPVAENKAAPSRAFAKLVEAQQRMGYSISPGQSVVDLGASPGGWSYVAVQNGASVIAVDRSELRPDLMSNRNVTFVKGDAFRFQPPSRVDWMVCDVIAAPERSIDNLLHWARSRWMNRFVVSIKFKGDTEYDKIDRLVALLPEHCDEFRLTRLNANKNEACAMGTVKL